MVENMHVSQIALKIDDLPAADAVLDDLLEVIVDRSLHLPGMFTLRLYSHDMVWLEDPTFREGKKVEIFFGEDPAVSVLVGQIAGLEPDLDENGPMLVVRGYDLSHTLSRGRQRRSFAQMTDADLARKLAMEAGLRPGVIDPTPEVHDYLFQNNQTNAEFLLGRARRLGYEFWVDDRTLHFRRPVPLGQPTRLVWGATLRHFRPRLSTAEQVNTVEVRGWDPRRKSAVVGVASQGNGAPQIGIGQNGSTIAQAAWGEAHLAVVDQYVRSPAEADRLAQAVLDEMASAFVEAEGTCDAEPGLVPGRQVQIDGVGARFSGTYYVTQVTHAWRASQPMTTHFTVSGRRDRGLWSLLAETPPRPLGMHLVIGIVTNNQDPENLGRVKVKFPWLCDHDESAWARLVSPMAGAGRGLFSLPEIDDEVLVGFEHGDIHRPFVLGGLWNGLDQPPLVVDAAVGGNGKVNQRILKSRSGHTITLNDREGAEEITIIDKTGHNKIVFHSPDNSLQITVQGQINLTARAVNIRTDKDGVDINGQKF
jgi:phage protein D